MEVLIIMEDKKAFVVYTNWKQYIDELTDEEVGMWTRWMFDYCNDKWLDKEIEYPNNTAVKVLCKLTKDILKKDLAKYKDKKKRIDEINERKRAEREAKSNKTDNENEHEIVNDVDNEIDDSNKLLVISNKIKEVSKDNSAKPVCVLRIQLKTLVRISISSANLVFTKSSKISMFGFWLSFSFALTKTLCRIRI
jgi:hypothetical protein